jgi:hypothetical protein
MLHLCADAQRPAAALDLEAERHLGAIRARVARFYALDSGPDLPSGAGKRELERALEGHTLTKADLIAR